MIKALIFDLDGTLADTIYAINNGLNLMLDELNFPRIGYNDVLSFINFGARGYVIGAVPKEFKNNEKLIDKALDLYNQKYALTYLETKECYDGVIDMLNELSKHFRLGMLSNKQDEFVKGLEKQLFPKGLFEISHGTRENVEPKPHPQAPLEFAEFFGLEPQEIAFIGDSDIDVLTAINSGMLPVDVSWGYRDEETLRQVGAKYVAHTPNELKEILLSLK